MTSIRNGVLIAIGCLVLAALSWAGFGGSEASAELGVVDARAESDAGAGLDRRDALAVVEYDDPDELEADVRLGRVGAGLILTSEADIVRAVLVVANDRPPAGAARLAVRALLRELSTVEITVLALDQLRTVTPSEAEAVAGEQLGRVAPQTVDRAESP